MKNSYISQNNNNIVREWHFFFFYKILQGLASKKAAGVLQIYRLLFYASCHHVVFWFRSGKKISLTQAFSWKWDKSFNSFSIIVDILGKSTGLDKWRVLKG